ncbi:MAG: HlyD family type I secretion periplasmic adaptor subunit [Pseudorhodoplanes sp.]
MSKQTRYEWENGIHSDSRKVQLAGYCAIALMIACFGYWAVTAPIAGAAVAPGTIAASGRNILIQHLEGGIIRKINVREGDHVAAGEELILLNDTSAKTQVNRLRKQAISLSATAERLAVERDDMPELRFSAALTEKADAGGMPDVLAEQVKEFDARLNRFKSEQDILNQRVSTLNESLSGLKAQKQALEKQLNIVEDDLVRKQALLNQGLTSHFEFTQMQRNQAELIGQASTIESDLASTRSQIIEAREQVERLRTQRVEQAVSQMAETRASLTDIDEQLEAAEAVLTRVSIRAPTDGIVVSALYNHEGSVISPGEKLMEILPTTTRSIVEARLAPTDIDAVRVGQDARLRLVALKARLTPEVSATVTGVSADRLIDQATQQPYFRARLQITDQLPEGVTVSQLYPGMPVEAFISTGERTFAEYLMRPIIDSFQRAFTEE